jgi:hypothetical protein
LCAASTVSREHITDFDTAAERRRQADLDMATAVTELLTSATGWPRRPS